MQYENHLVDPIHCLLDAADASLSEYDLIQQLRGQGWLPEVSMGDTVSLYSAHFLVYNALFQLCDTYRQQGKQLYISALSIYWYPIEAPSIDIGDGPIRGVNKVYTSSPVLPKDICHTDNQAVMPELHAYYLDWNHLEKATQDSVDDLLRGFWERFSHESGGLREQHEQAYNDAIIVLGVGPHTSYKDIKHRYRQLVMEHHPDRHGDKNQFQAIQSAFSLIRRYRQYKKVKC